MRKGDHFKIWHGLETYKRTFSNLFTRLRAMGEMVAYFESAATTLASVMVHWIGSKPQGPASKNESRNMIPAYTHLLAPYAHSRRFDVAG